MISIFKVFSKHEMNENTVKFGPTPPSHKLLTGLWSSWYINFTLENTKSFRKYVIGYPCISVLSRFSRVQLCATLWTVAHHTPLSMGFSTQVYWSRSPCPPPGDLPNAGLKPSSLTSPAMACGFFTTSPPWEAHGSHPCDLYWIENNKCGWLKNIFQLSKLVLSWFSEVSELLRKKSQGSTIAVYRVAKRYFPRLLDAILRIYIKSWYN